MHPNLRKYVFNSSQNLISIILFLGIIIFFKDLCLPFHHFDDALLHNLLFLVYCCSISTISFSAHPCIQSSFSILSLFHLLRHTHTLSSHFLHPKICTNFDRSTLFLNEEIFICTRFQCFCFCALY